MEEGKEKSLELGVAEKASQVGNVGLGSIQTYLGIEFLLRLVGKPVFYHNVHTSVYKKYRIFTLQLSQSTGSCLAKGAGTAGGGGGGRQSSGKSSLQTVGIRISEVRRAAMMSPQLLVTSSSQRAASSVWGQASAIRTDWDEEKILMKWKYGGLKNIFFYHLLNGDSIVSSQELKHLGSRGNAVAGLGRGRSGQGHNGKDNLHHGCCEGVCWT